jgi:hypothetical protein
VGEF